MTKQWVPDGPRPSRVQRRDDNVFVMDPVHEGEGAVVMRRYFEAAFKWPVEIEMWDIPVGAWEGRHVHDEADPDGYVIAFRYRWSFRENASSPVQEHEWKTVLNLWNIVGGGQTIDGEQPQRRWAVDQDEVVVVTHCMECSSELEFA